MIVIGRFYSKKVSDEVYGEFDSTTEFKYFQILLKRQELGEISNLERQTVFMLQDKFKMKDGTSIRAITYKADFTYWENEQLVIVDCKGCLLFEETFKIKWKIAKKLNPECKFEILIMYEDEWYNVEDPIRKKIMKNKIAEKKRIAKEKREAKAKATPKKKVTKKKVVKKK